MRRLTFVLSIVGLCWSHLAWSDQGAAIAALTPGRDGKAELHLEVREEALAADLLKAPASNRFRILLRAGQGRVIRASWLNPEVEGGHTVLAFDQSASFRPYMNDAMALAQRFLTTSLPSASFTVLAFGTSLGTPLDAPSPAEAQRHLSMVAKSALQPQTRLKASIRESVILASQRLPMPRGVRQVVVFTDAGEESSVYSTDQVVSEARQRGVRIHTIVLGPSKGVSLAQRRDDMKKLAEETGGYAVEVQSQVAATPQVERVARSSQSILRLSLEFCDVPSTPSIRDEQVQVEILDSGAAVASTNWVTFSQQASGAALRPCNQPAPVATSSSPPSTPPSTPPPSKPPQKGQTKPGSPLSLLWLLVGLGVLGVLAVLLAILFRGRRRTPAPPSPVPTPIPPPTAVPPLPNMTPWVNPSAAPLSPENPLSTRPGPWMEILRAPVGIHGGIRIKNNLSVGASSDSDLRLDVSEVSSRHARIELSEQGEVFLLDLNSTNGTFLEGQRLTSGQRTLWKPGQTVSFSTKVEVRLDVR